MKNPTLHFICLLAISFFFTNCGKDDDVVQEPDPKQVFEGVKLYDENGSPIGCFGDCDDDWTNFALEDSELAFLDFTDTLDISNAASNTSINGFYIYPNPISNSGTQGWGVESVGVHKMKIAVVDECNETQFTHAFKIENGFNNFNLSNVLYQDFERKKIYRIYYKLTDVNDSIIYQGYGDMSVCVLEGGNNNESCFN